MVIALLEPVFAGVLVSLLNKYLINGSGGTWLQNWCVPPEDKTDKDEEMDVEGDSTSSKNTTISDADVLTHCH